jgi:enoyl-[acyl-carrier-protein] reductase (NADH)
MTEIPITANMLKIAAMRVGAARQCPFGGIQSAEQVANVMTYLMGEGAARLTGQVIAVDGGFTTVRPLVRRHKHLDQLSPHEFERQRQTAL